MQCDDHGIFEWKPIVLKALIFPADNVDFAAVLAEFERLGCVRRIDIQGRPHGVVRNFAKYQRPKNPSYRHFKADELPAEVGSYIGVRGAATPVLPQPYPIATEIPPLMKEEGGKREEEGEEEISRTPSAPSASDAFERFKRAYPRRGGANPWQPAEKKFNALVKTGVDPEAMIQAAAALAREEAASGNVGTKFIPQAITWLNQQRFQDQAVAAFSSVPDKLGMDDAIAMFAKTGQWSRFAPVSDISQAPAELLAKHGLSPDGRRMQ
jgi:hypothetical protein